MSGLPLEGVRVLDLTVVWAGPYCCQLLADWGAEVIRVESIQTMAPATRGLVVWPSRQQLDWSLNAGFGYAGRYPKERPWDKGPFFNSHARNKLSMTVDLRTPEGLDIFKRLVRVSDLFIENNVPQTIEKLGVTYEELRNVREDLIVVRMPGFGLNGPYKNYRTWGAHGEGVAGHSWVKGYPDADPSGRAEVYASDSAAGLNAALSALMALRHRNRTGEGQLIEVSLCENFIPYLGEAIMDYTLNGRVQGTPGNRHTSMAPHGCYPCKGEDRWVVIAVGSDEEWRGLYRAMGNPEWAEDKKFSTVLGRWHHQDELDRHISRWTSGLDHYEIMCRLQEEGVAAGPVLDERDAHNDPHFEARGVFQELADPECGTHRHVGCMWKMSEAPNRLRRPPCHLGADNEYVYKELLGLNSEEYARLEEEGHIGVEPASHLP
ncbi:MAG: CaiB/BaiF CoA transferase family protein [Dehalococcoidia bacterium]